MEDTENVTKSDSDGDLAYTQAMKYGQDLARLYAQEKAKRRELELANQKLQAILGTAPNGLAVLDEAMTIVEANPRFEALVEQNGSCVGHSLTDVLPCEDLIPSLQAASSEEKRFAEVEVSLAHLMGRTLHVTSAPLSAGDQHGWVISLHDFTERKRLEGLKEEFISIAAHELRTPLAIILGYTSVLREDTQDSDDTLVVTSIDAITRAANRLAMVIGELVGFAAAKSTSSDDIGGDCFDLWTVIHHAVSSVRHQANLQNINIFVEAADEPLTIYGDRAILAQAIGHLLDNAIKFNRPGGQIQVRANQAKGETVLEIEDTGMGIPLTDLDKIFDLFYQVEGHMTRAQGGLGLGLAIAQRGVELHGGHISVDSSLNRGSCFRVVLPPSAEQSPIAPQTRLETAHQQTLAFGRDLAHAFAARQAMARRLNHVSALGSQLLARLEQLSLRGAGEELASSLDEACALARQLVDEAESPGATQEKRR